MAPNQESGNRIIKAISMHDFRNQELIGEGCFGQVYKAEWVPNKDKGVKRGQETKKTKDEIKETEETKDTEEIKDIQDTKDVKDTEEIKNIQETKDTEETNETNETNEIIEETKEGNAKTEENCDKIDVICPANTYEDPAIQVTIKVMKNASSRQVMAERDRLAIPNHENVVKLLGAVYLWKGTTIAPWLVMENLPLGNLRKYIVSQRNTGGIAANGMMKIAWGIAHGMEYLHSIGIIHGDLSTRNCILGDKWSVKIGDLGYYDEKNSRYYHEYKQQNETICPIRWTPPENLPYRVNRSDFMVPCRPRQSFAGDIWAYGVVLFELWSRAKDPFHKLSDNYDVCDAILQNLKPTDFQRIKMRRHIWNLMHHCWEFMPNARPRAAEVVDHFEVNEGHVWLMANDYISI